MGLSTIVPVSFAVQQVVNQAENGSRMIDLQGTAKSFAIGLGNLAGSLYPGSSFCLTLYLLFCFLRDTRSICAAENAWRIDVLVARAFRATALGPVMALLSIFPVLGAFVIRLPAAFSLVPDGNPGNALIISL
jgi:predicted PurR-regulated permease PerM